MGNAMVSNKTTASAPAYYAYPAALAALARRLNATPVELAAWVYDGGLVAYSHACELDPPPRFRFPTGHPLQAGKDHDYTALMMACWFRSADIDAFAPKERYLCGAALVARWSEIAGIDPRALIVAKIHASRLTDAHPIYGGTQGSFSNPAYPPLELGLFALAEVAAIEAETFGAFQREAVQPRPPLQQAHQESEILRKLRELGFDPQRLPPLGKGRKGVAKAAIRSSFPQWASPSSTVLEHAWERLLKSGQIAYKINARSKFPPNWGKGEG